MSEHRQEAAGSRHQAAGEKSPPRPIRAQGGRFWSLLQEAERPGVLQLYIYGDVEGGYWDWWSGEYVDSDTSAEHFREELGKYPNASEIKIYINSYGGEVFEGTAIYNQLKRHPAHKTVYIDGFACSIASVIAMAGDEVVMPRNTLMMIHNAWMATFGNAAQLRKAADDLDVINAAGRQAYLQKAGDKLSEEKLIEMMDAETWLTAQACIELGLADRFADEDADLSEAAEVLQRVNLSLEQQVERHKSIAARVREIETGRAAKGPERAAEGGGPYGEMADSAGDGRGAEDAAPYAAEPDEPKANSLMSFLAGVDF